MNCRIFAVLVFAGTGWISCADEPGPPALTPMTMCEAEGWSAYAKGELVFDDVTYPVSLAADEADGIAAGITRVARPGPRSRYSSV